MAQSKQCSLVGSLTVGVALAVFTLCGQAAAQATIPAPGFQPSGLAFDGTFLYVLEDSGVRTIFKLDPQTGACLDSFVLGNNPDGLAFDGSSRLFVSDILGFVREIDTAGPLTVFNQFSLPFRGGAIAFDGTNLYIGDIDSRQILVTDSSGVIIRTFAAPLRPAGMTFDPATGHLWAISEFNEIISEFTTEGDLIGQCVGPRDAGSQGLGGMTWVDSKLYIAEASDPVPFGELQIPGTIFVIDRSCNPAPGFVRETVVDRSCPAPVSTVSPPVVTNPGNQSSSEGDSVALQIQASDPDGDTLTYSAIGLPPGLSIGSSSGLISGTLGLNTARNYTVAVSVSDGTLSTSVNFNWLVNQATSPPVVTNPGSQSSSAGDSVALQIQASDPDGDTLTYSAIGLPPGLSIGSSSGLISGTLDFDTAETYAVIVSATDGTSSTSVNFNWLVNQATIIDIKPGGYPNSINCNDDQGVIPVAILTTDTFDATTVDHTTVIFEGAGETHVNRQSGEPSRHEEDVDDDGDTDLVLHFGLRDTALTCDSTEGTLAGQTFDGEAFEGTDSVDMVEETTAVISVVSENNPLVVTNPGSQSSSEGDSVALQIQASDPDGDTLTYSAIGLPPGLSIGSSSGLISGTLDFDTAETYAVIVSATDGTSSTSVNFQWLVNGVEASETVLIANFMNGNSAFFKSRVYLWNPSSSAGDVTVRVFTLPLIGGTAQELTTTALNLGSLGAKSALNLRLEDILDALFISTPYETDGGNLTLEFTIQAANVGGVAEVFSDSLAFGTYPLQGIPSTSTGSATVLVANFTNGNNAFLNSRVYLWNPSQSAGSVTVRAYTLPSSGPSILLGTAELGLLDARSSLNIKIAEDVLSALGIPLPYTDDVGNLTIEFTVGAENVRGVAQVFSLDLAYGTYPMQLIQ